MHTRGVTPAGTRVLWVESDEPELAYVSVAFAVGFGTLPPRAAHFAHFVEHIVAHLTPDERRRVDASGVECNASTSEHTTVFHASGLASGILRTYLPLLAARIASPPSDALTHRNEALAVVTEIQQHGAQPSAAHRAHVARLERPDSIDAVGFEAHAAFMSKLSRTPSQGLVASYVRAHYVHTRAHVTVSCARALRGALVAAALDALGHAPREVAAPRMPRAASSALEQKKASVLRVDACSPEAKTHITILVPVAVSANELPVADFCAETLRTALFDELRTRLGLLYSVHVSYVSHSPTAREHDRCRQELAVYAMCDGSNVVRAVAAARRVIAALEATDTMVVEWCDSTRASVLSARACRTPESLASWYESHSFGGYPLRSHEATLSFLHTFPIARAREVGRSLRAAPLRVYVTTGDARPDVVHASLARSE